MSRHPRIIIDPDDHPDTAKLLKRLHAPYDGVLVVELTSASKRTLYGLAASVHEPLGKRLPTEGSRMNGLAAWRQAAAWVIATEPEHLLVARANTRQRDHWERLTQLAHDAGAQPWLLVSGTAMSRGHKEFARDYAIVPEGPEALEADIPRARGTTPRGQIREFPPVPDEAAPTFLHTCRSMLTKSEFLAVESVYWPQFDNAYADFEAGMSDPRTWLARTAREIGRRSRGNLDESLVRLRAVQAAGLRCGYLIGADRSALAAGYTGQPMAAATDANLRALRVIPGPGDAALAVVSLCTHLPPPQLAQLNLDAVTAGGEQIHLPSGVVSVPPEGRTVLRAHCLERGYQGAGAGDPLFVCEDRRNPRRGLKRTDPHGLQQRLRRTAEKSGLILTNRDSWGHDKPPRWIARRKLSIIKLKELQSC